MWQCLKCGNSIEDDLDMCWSCGTSRDGVEDPAFRPEEGAQDEPLAQRGRTMTDVQERSELPASSTNTDAQSDPVWSEAGLAALLLRLLGVYFMAWAIIGGADTAMRLFLASRDLGLDLVLSKHWTYLTYFLAELAVGIYLLVGGRWVYEKVLTPMARNPMPNAVDDTDESKVK